MDEKQPCTAILDLRTYRWRKLKFDSRLNVNESLRGYLIRLITRIYLQFSVYPLALSISDDDEIEIYYMGGHYVQFGQPRPEESHLHTAVYIRALFKWL